MPKTAAATVAPISFGNALYILTYLAKFPLLADGIYIGLDDERYHADPALGSSNIRDILKGANLYWHKSFMNPHRKAEKSTPAKLLGKATHKLLLEDFKPFDAIYKRGPYDGDFDGTPAEKSALTKAAKSKLMKGQELISADDYDFIMGVKDVIDADPELTGCLDNGLSEVSIFWTRPDGVRCKARFDKLKLGGVGDIKTIANERERDLEQACKLDISTYRYDIPAEHYLEGRRQLPALLKAGAVFAGEAPLTKDDHGADKILSFLARVAEQKTFAFQIVFIPKKGAPDAWSCVLSPGNPILTGAHTDIETAISYYRVMLDKFGADKRWLPGREVLELAIEEMPWNFGRPVKR